MMMLGSIKYKILHTYEYVTTLCFLSFQSHAWLVKMFTRVLRIEWNPQPSTYARTIVKCHESWKATQLIVELKMMKNKRNNNIFNCIWWNVIISILICLMVFQLYRAGQFYWWRKPEYQEKTTDPSKVTGKLDHIMMYTSPSSRFELTTSVVIGTDYIGSCKSNYHTITTTTAPY
jgi:hypothetical protein